jgi:hypothetical protein
MSSAFDSLDAEASDVVAEAFGESAVLIPRRGNQYVEAAADIDRMAASVRGVFSGAAAGADLKGQARGGDFPGTTRIVAEQTAFWISAARIAALGFRPAKGDLLRLPERSGRPSYAISAVHPTSLGDLNLLLVREDVAE